MFKYIHNQRLHLYEDKINTVLINSDKHNTSYVTNQKPRIPNNTINEMNNKT